MQGLLDKLASIVGPEHVLKAPEEMAPFLNDWRKRYQGAASCVVRPASTEEVAQVVEACQEAGARIVAQGGNTGLVGGGIPKGDEVLLSLARLNRIRAVDVDNNTLVAEAGCILAHVQATAADANRLFPLSLAAEGSATIGGNISTNAGGVQVLRYGNMRDLVLGLEVVLPDGSIWNGLRALRKDNTGYDIKHLFIGAEGTLGIVTAAVLKLFPRPQAQLTAWLAVPTPEAAVATLSALRASAGDRVTAFELIGREAYALVAKHYPQVGLPECSDHPWYILLDLSDTWAQAPLEEILSGALVPLMEAGQVLDAVVASSAAQADALWRIRETIPDAQKVEGFSIKHDISMPISAIGGFIRECEIALRAAYADARIVCFGHVGDGNLHYNVSPAAGDSTAFLENSDAVNKIVHDLVYRLHGSISAEHGIGQLKAKSLKDYKSSTELRLMQAVKHALDPRQCMNPGKIFSEE